MSATATVILALFGAFTPFLLVALAWMRSISAQLHQLHVDVVDRGARHDVVLTDHERRITDIEHTHPRTART